VSIKNTPVKPIKLITVLQVIISFIHSNCSFSQQANGTNSPKIDSTKKELYLKGAVTITNKGISYIPNLSLGKPAIIFDLSIANKKLSFEPQLRFSLAGEPWAFLFPLRYKIKSTGKFQMTLGVNPLMNFKPVTYTLNGVSTTELANRRYLSGEFRPNYFITKSISVGINYFYFCGVSNRAVKNTHFVSFNTNFSDIKLGNKFFAKFNPQVYYLYQDAKEGYYFNAVVMLLKRNFPFALQTNMTASIQTTIPGSEKFIWNVSLIYAFNKAYVQK
jgi:hypothetical protein